MLTRYLLFWLVLAVIAVANGILRQATYGKAMPELVAHQFSTLTGIIATGIAVWPVSRLWPIESASQARVIGTAWLLMTVVFEFGFGHFVAGHSWANLLADYNLRNGRVWLLFVAWIALMPYLFFRLHQASA